MKRTVIAGMLVTMMSGQALANGIDGNFLHRGCEKSTPFASGYIVGVVDGYFYSNSTRPEQKEICFPEGASMRQVTDIVCGYLKSHPENGHEPAGQLAYNSLVEAWPCQ